MYEALHIQDFGCIGHRTLPDGRVIINVPTAAMFDIDPEGASFDRISRAVNEEFDLRSNDQHLLIASALQNGGAILKNRRKQLVERVSAGAFEFIEALVKAELAQQEAPSPSRPRSGPGL